MKPHEHKLTRSLTKYVWECKCGFELSDLLINRYPEIKKIWIKEKHEN